ncbi:hypothetical protein BJX68DRAFT_226097 [Aspergillus pseudodeflectus]|uniref:Secreted protein n=1 Tax=Aspergillus pseudodeflectus TaxID=176178 RepID=A0ABR4L494_9EURO
MRILVRRLIHTLSALTLCLIQTSPGSRTPDSVNLPVLPMTACVRYTRSLLRSTINHGISATHLVHCIPFLKTVWYM